MNRIIHTLSTSRTALILLLATLLNATTAQTARAQELTDFLPVSSSGTASGYFAFSDHFYRVDWTGINTSQTTSVLLNYNATYGYLEAQTNGDTSVGTFLTNADASLHWKASDITGLTPGQSSDGYTSYGVLSANAGNKSAKVCTVTCVAALKPKWNWSSDHSTCTATFMCAENTSLTATVDATVTSSSEPYAANVTFNGTSYSYVAPVTYNITYVLNGGTNAASNPNTYRDDETVTLSDPMRPGYVFEGWYDNSGFSGTAVTGIPYDSSGDKTFYAKWKAEIDGLTYDATIGGFIIDSPEALNTLATYSQSNNCSGKTFKQTADIALSGSFTGIGCYDHRFSGTYDGGNHYITGLYEKKYVNYLGLFRMTDGATISNVRLVSPYIDSSNTDRTKFSDGIGGLIGSSNNTTVSDCYVLNPTVIGNSGWSGAIVGWGSVSGNYYYTENDALPAVGNGSSTAIRLRKLTLPGSVTGGSVTASSGVQLNYNNTLYCAENASVTLTITPEKGYILSALTVNGTDVTGSVSNNSYTFNMPTEDITVTAAFVKETFTYVDMNGVTQTVEAERITSDSAVGLYSGWYAVGGNVTRNSGFNLVGNGVVINIILCDGATLSLPNSTINTTGGKPNLVIWGQENGTGTLSCLSISDQVTSVTVNGGKLYCSVSNYNCAINGNLNVNGGEVHLAAGFNTCVNGSVTYNGGILDTKKISGNTTLNWSKAATDRVKVSEYVGSVTIADGKFFKDASGNYYYGSLTDAQKNAIKNVELQPSPNAHFITVDAAVHGAATAPAVAESGNTVTVTVAPDTGYKVASVKYNNTDATKVDDTHFTFTMPTSNVTVTASFQPITYTITYNNVEGATFVASNPVSYTVEGEAITLNNPIKTGYTFGGWTGTDLDVITQTVTIPSGSTGDRAYTANWTAHTYSVQFNGNDATGGEMSAQSFTYDEPNKALTANAYTRTGYHFTGWNTAADGTGTAYTDGQAVQNLTAENGATVTLYAQWTANTYTVHFVAGIPVNGEMPDQSLTYGQAANLTANAFSTTKGSFVNWNTEADGSGTNYADEALVQNLTAEDGGVVTLYAQWRLAHRFIYDNTIFRCSKVDTPNEVYRAYAGETVKVEVIDPSSEYTIRVVNGDGEDITLDTDNTFVMPNEEVWITYTSVKRMSYTTISLDNFESWDDVAYLYDASQPTVTPTVTVKDGENVLTKGTDYTVEITNNTGSATQMVTATVTVTGMGGYVGTNTQKFRITPFNIANCEIKGTLEAYDDGYGPYSPLKRNVQVWNGDTQLEVGTDYTIELDPNIGIYDYVVGEQYQATVKGTGDWGGSQTFRFKVIELHHTVAFVANGGSGTMASDVATKGQHYTLPPCGFTAPDGKKFSHWVASCEPDAEKQPGDYFTAPIIWSVDDVQTISVTAYWRDKATCTVTLPEEMEVVSGTLTDGKAIEDEVITFRPRPGFTATDVQANGIALTPDGEGIYTLTVTTDVTVTVGTLAPIDWATVNEGTSADPYMIYNKDQLLLLAHRVNGTNGETADTYQYKYFKLGADITFSHEADEGDDYDENYEAIGGNYNSTTCFFYGNFDGDGHTVSGIRIRKDGSGTADYCQGLFGCIGIGAEIHDVHLTDARIKGNANVGGIAGYKAAGNIMRCTVTDSYITATGIRYYGTISGTNNGGTLTNNYYHGCTVNGTKNATNVGCTLLTGIADLDDEDNNNGALPAYRLALGDGVTIQTPMAADLGFSCDADNDGTAENYWRTGAVLTLGYTGTAPDGYIVSGYTATNGTVGGNANDGYTLTMPDQDVTITTAITPDPAHFSVNDAGTEYTILTTTGWNVFCDLLADNAKGYFSDKTVRLGADITVTRMAGGQPFTGTFDGQWHTLTLDYGTADAPIDAQFVAPFIETAADGDHQPTFRNLTIDGTIYEGYTGSEAHNVGGLIGHLFGTVTIEHCTSNVSINATSGAGGFVGLCEHSVSFNDCHSAAVVRSADGSNSGFVAWSRASAYTIAFTGCLFDGKLLQQGGNGSLNGGFIGWTGATKTVTITNSLCAPAPLATGETMASSGSATFARGWNATTTATNCYYTAAFDIAQGKATRTVSPGADVTIEAVALTGTPTQYTVSGITAYSGGGLQRGQTLYYGSGDQLSLTLTTSAQCDQPGYQYAYTASAGTLSGSTLTMPDENVTITTAIRSDGLQHEVSYMTADGTTQTAQAIALDGTETSLAAGWYFVGKDISYKATLTLGGDVNLILADGCEMKVGESGSEVDGYGIICYDEANNTYYDLTICGQTAQTGTLSVYTTGQNNYAIGTRHITVNGGNVIAHTDGSGCGIDTKRSGNVTINRGSVSATTTYTGIFAWAISAAGNLTINGGNVSAKSNSHAIQADGNVAINGGTVNATGGDGGFSGIYSNGTIEINGGNVTASSIYSDGTAITLGWTRPDDRITASSISTYEGGTVAVASGKKLHNGTDYLDGTLGDPATAVNGKTLRPAATATYTTADGNADTADAILLDTGDTSLPAGNYLATGTLNYTHGITLTGNVTLILADNCHMNVGTSGERIEDRGIDGYDADPDNWYGLTITSESLGDDMGALSVYTTGTGNYGIWANALTINGGHVTSDTNGAAATALYATLNDLTINSGTVTATAAGTEAHAIAAAGNFNYNGGIVTATGGPDANAIWAYCNYTFNWRTPADRITIGATGLYAPAAKTATFTRLFTDATGNYYGATLTGTALNALKGVTLEAAETADFTVTLAPKGYGTYYDGHYDITLPAGTQARIVTARGATDGTLDYETIADGDDGITLPKTVPAGTAVMLCHDGGGYVTLTVHDADIDDRDFTDTDGNTLGLVSLLHGSDVATETTGGTLYYKLTYGSAAGHESIFGWYWGAANGAAFESPAHKAWLALPAAEARSFIGLPDFDEQTGITTTNYTNDTNSAGAWYTLDGRKLDGTPMKSGIYVNNGKKVIIK